jgi:hypothetical protein
LGAVTFLGLNGITLFSNAHARTPTAGTDNIPSVSRQAAPVEKIFVPQGFDDNDNIEVVIQGRFPDACMKTGPVETRIDHTTQTVTLKPEVYVYRGEPCAQVIIPFTQRVTLGTLQQGTWKILLEGAPAIAPLPLVITHAQSAAPDEVLYAPVDEVVMLPDLQGRLRKLVISGNWPQIPNNRGCFALKEIRTFIGADDTVVVRPIAELLAPALCSPTSQRKRVFQGSVLLDRPLQRDSLIHIRTLNGESLNKFYEAP